MIIRQYKPSDRIAIEEIQFNTYFLGKPMSEFVSSRKPFSAELVHYFEKPQGIFVAEDKGKIVGYLIGCLDDAKQNKKQNKNLFYLKFVLKNFIKSFSLPKKDRVFWRSRVVFLFQVMLGKSGELKMKTPEDAGHLHINLLPSARGSGVGSRLLKAFFSYAKKKGAKVIHADSFQTRINPNKNFWLRNGFEEYSKVKTRFWKKQLPEEEIFSVCYVKEL